MLSTEVRPAHQVDAAASVRSATRQTGDTIEEERRRQIATP